MIVIGADTHKRNHTLVALDGQTGALRGQRAIPASDAGSLDALRLAAELDEERVWAIDPCSAARARGYNPAGSRVTGSAQHSPTALTTASRPPSGRGWK